MTEADSAYNAEWSKLRAAWLRRVQKAYRDLLWRYGLKMTPATLGLVRSQKIWGHWAEDQNQIIISEELILNHPWNAVMGILGHETAHQMVSRLAAPKAHLEPPHGQTFQDMAARLGLDPFYCRAKVDLREDCPAPLPDHSQSSIEDKSARILEKVKKLLALSGSPVAAEAQAAMNAAARLMAKHNLEVLDNSNPNGQAAYEYRSIALGTNRLSARLALITHILNRHFFVETIFVPGYNPLTDTDEKILEIMGRPENTCLAEHVFHFLLERSENLWQQYHRTRHGGGLTARNSFIIGLLEGFNRKLDEAAAASSEGLPATPPETGFSALVLAKDKGLGNFIKIRHPRIVTSRGSGRRRFCPESDQAGQAAGRALNLNNPVESRADRASLFLPGGR